MKKTTKIIGAVLGVLLVAALFVGAGAAAPTVDFGNGTVDVNLFPNDTATVTVTFAAGDDGTYTLLKNDYLVFSNPVKTLNAGTAKITEGVTGYKIDLDATAAGTITFKATAVKTTPINTGTGVVGTEYISLLDASDGSAIASGHTFSVSPKIEIVPAPTGNVTLVIGEKINVKITGTAGDVYSLKAENGLNPGVASGAFKNVTLGADGTLTVELTADTASGANAIKLYTKNATPAAVAVTGVVTAQTVAVEIFTFTVDTKAADDGSAGATAIAKANPLKVGDSFPITFKGGDENVTYYVEYEEDIFSIPGGVDGKARLISGQPLTVSVIGVPKDEKSELAPGASDGTAIGPVSIYITPEVEVVKSVGFGDEFTYKVFGAKNDSYTLAYLENGAAPGVPPTIIQKKGVAVATALPATITMDENGYGELTFVTGLTAIGDVKISLGVALTPATIDNTVTVGPKVTVESITSTDGNIYAGDLIKVTVNAPANGGGEAYAISDSAKLFADVQEGVTKMFGPRAASALALYAFDYNVFPAAAAPVELTLYMKSEADLEGYKTAIKVVTVDVAAAVPTNFVKKDVGTKLVEFKGTGIVPISEGQTYYAYVPYDALTEGQTWYLLDSHKTQTNTSIKTVEVDGDVYFDGLEEAGLYQLADGTQTVRVEFPTISATAVVNGPNGYKYALAGGFVPKDEQYEIAIGNVSASGADLDQINWQLVDANGAVKKVEISDDLTFDFENETAGEYVLQPYFVDFLVKLAPDYLTYGPEIPFTLGKIDDDAKIKLSAEKVTVGEKFVATVSGHPGKYYTISVPEKSIIIPAQKDVVVDGNEAEFQMGASGIFNVTLQAKAKTDDATIDLWIGTKNEDDASIEIIDGVLTVTADKEWYTIGDDIKLEGTYSSEDSLYIFVEGTNKAFSPITKNRTPLSTNGKEWDVKVKFDYLVESIGSPDAGTYTFYVAPYEPDYAPGQDLKDAVTDGVYETIAVPLKQSFITLTSAPTVVAQGEKIEVEGTANAADSVIWYLFGTNFFAAGTQKVKDDVFTITVKKEDTKSDVMAAGQYFLVVQHPMYDKLYSIAPEDMDGMSSGEYALSLDAILKSDKDGIYYSGATLTKAPGYTVAALSPLFSTDLRQTANAAQALCDALDSQNFDDMYAKASFIVGAPTSIVNPIPTKVTQGEKITISGNTTGHVGDVVSVEFLSTAFAAVPKQAVGTAAFVTVNTKVQDDGTWTIEFDTSNLNADDYTASVAVGSLGPVTSKITVVKGDAPVTPTAQPTGEPTTAPTTAPTQTPASPGFGILAALAGLGAVAVLLLRRQ